MMQFTEDNLYLSHALFKSSFAVESVKTDEEKQTDLNLMLQTLI